MKNIKIFCTSIFSNTGVYMRAAFVLIAGVTSRRERTYATMKGASDILGTHFDRLRRSKNEVLILDGGTGEEL
jgi:hypothetical protein